MTTYTASLRLAEPTPGDPAVKDTWGTILNTNDVLLDAAINANAAISLAGLTAYTLTTANGAPDQARQASLPFTGAIPAACTVTLPNVQRIGWAVNLTTGGFNVILTTGAGTKATLPPDGVWRLYSSDGAGNIVAPNLTSTGGAIAGTSLNISGTASVQGNISGGANITAQGTMGAPTIVASATAQVIGLLTAGAAQVNGAINVAGNAAVGTLSTSGSVANASVSPNSNVAIFAAVQLPTTTTTTNYFGNVTSTSSLFGAWQFNGNLIGSIAPNGSGTGATYNTTSDQRLKTPRGLIEDVGSLIDRLKPRWFNWRDNPDAEPEPGFFAQEAHRVWKWSVTKGRGRKGRKGYMPWQMDNAKLVPLLVAEIQDLRRRVQKLERSSIF